MTTDFKNCTLLIVDDYRENLNVVGNVFKELGYKLAFAQSGPEALEILDTAQIDIILLDIMMPDMDGFEVCAKIKANSKLKDIPVIFLTAKIDTDSIVTGFLQGGVDYVTKPFKKEELICRVNTHLELKAAKEIIKHQNEELRQSNRLLMTTLHKFGQMYELLGEECSNLRLENSKKQ
jgi:PleD family two-component response regulator